MKLSEWAKKNSVTYRTAFTHYQQGKIPNAYALATGTIVVPDEPINKKTEYNIVYARVSSSENKSNLESQAKRITEFCNAKGWIPNEVVKEIASGVNDNRPKLNKILKEQKATRIIIEHKDRLTRFGFNYIKNLLKDCEIVIINPTEENEKDLMQDFVSIITSFFARIYGYRRTKRQTEKLIEELKKKND
jgi:predicted site-specific integrase-resolvase